VLDLDQLIERFLQFLVFLLCHFLQLNSCLTSTSIISCNKLLWRIFVINGQRSFILGHLQDYNIQHKLFRAMDAAPQGLHMGSQL
jgi:hypothetical protein